MKLCSTHIRVAGLAAAAVSLLGLAIPAHAAPARLVRHAYHSPAMDLELGSGEGGAGTFCASPVTLTAIDCLQTAAEPHDKTVRVEMRDLTGLPVLGYFVEQGQLFCGSATWPVYGGERITIEAPVGVAAPTCSEPTRGTIVATFTSS